VPARRQVRRATLKQASSIEHGLQTLFKHEVYGGLRTGVVLKAWAANADGLVTCAARSANHLQTRRFPFANVQITR